ncbi:hypothetical protein GCM10010398_26110 [Streptomyces fimbriatus]
MKSKVKKQGQDFRSLHSWSTKDSTARETKGIREDHLQNAFWPHGPSMDTGHPRDVDPSITGQPHQVTGKVPT